MTKSELIAIIAEKTDISKSRATTVVTCILDSMVTALEQGESIELRGFGTFTVRKYNSYSGRNPLTGESVQVAEKRLPFFKAGKALKALLKGSMKKDRKQGRMQK